MSPRCTARRFGGLATDAAQSARRTRESRHEASDREAELNPAARPSAFNRVSRGTAGDHETAVAGNCQGRSHVVVAHGRAHISDRVAVVPEARVERSTAEKSREEEARRRAALDPARDNNAAVTLKCQFRIPAGRQLEVRVDDTGCAEAGVRLPAGREPPQREEHAVSARRRSVSRETFIAAEQDPAVTLDRDGGRQAKDAAAGEACDTGAAEAGIEEPSRCQPENVELAAVEVGPRDVHAPPAIHRDRSEEALPTETNFLFAAAAKHPIESPRLRQTQNPKDVLAQTMESSCDNDSTDTVERKFSSD